MELPKNLIQMGKPDKLHKIFVEDYVVSYMKQLNRISQGKTVGIALYGQKYVEDNVRYYFLYGAAEIAGLEGRGQYLSELERESIEKVQRDFFESCQFLAWCTLSGELPEGFYLMEQGKGLLINGYACFFEKNESMLNFLVTSGGRGKSDQRAGERRENSPGEQRDLSAETMGRPAAGESKQDFGRQKKASIWDPGRLTDKGDLEHRLSERSRKLTEVRGQSKKEVGKPAQEPIKWRTVWVGAVILLCVIGIATLGDEEKRKELQVAARQVIESLSEQKLPDMEESVPGSTAKESASLENQPVSQPETEGSSQTESRQEVEQESRQPESEQPESQPASEQQAETQPEADASQEAPETQPESEEVSQEVQVQTVTYVVQKGDTLLDLCRERYGADEILQQICDLNNIEDADDIKVGQIILLPK